MQLINSVCLQIIRLHIISSIFPLLFLYNKERRGGRRSHCHHPCPPFEKLRQRSVEARTTLLHLHPIIAAREGAVIHRIEVVPKSNNKTTHKKLNMICANKAPLNCWRTVEEQRRNAYFSVNILCWTLSAHAKNSSISWEVGMFRCIDSCILWLVLFELDRLVVDPGVPMVSESLIRLQGVVSLTFLQPSYAAY